MLAQRLLQGVDAQPVFISGDTDHAQVMVGKDAQGQEVARLFDKDHVARLRVEGANKLERQRGAGADKQVVVANRKTIAGVRKLANARRK